MERLTKRRNDGSVISAIDCPYGCQYLTCSMEEGYQCKHECEADVYCKLADYEDLEEQGLLLKLPCKVGDTIYKLWYKPCHHGNDTPDSWNCCGCEDECDLKKEIFEFTVPSLEWILQHMKYFGDCVWFLTREEAEEHLKEKF